MVRVNKEKDSFRFSIMRNKSKWGAPCLRPPRCTSRGAGCKETAKRCLSLRDALSSRSAWQRARESACTRRNFPGCDEGVCQAWRRKSFTKMFNFLVLYIIPKGHRSDGILPEGRLTAMSSMFLEVHDVRPAWRMLRSLSKSRILSRERRPCDMPGGGSLPLAANLLHEQRDQESCLLWAAPVLVRIASAPAGRAGL